MHERRAAVKIELNVFSGRRNPSWGLTPEEITGFVATLRALPRSVGPLEFPERLGYCGIVVSDEDASQPWAEVVVYHELVRVNFGNRTDYLIDDDRTVENLLLETARGQVKDAVIARIRAEPQSPSEP
jgi:hypothetical protein